jgi:hypothetical protein
MITIAETIEGMRIPGIGGRPHGKPHGKPIIGPKTTEKTIRMIKIPMIIPKIGVPVLVPKHILSSYFLREVL